MSDLVERIAAVLREHRWGYEYCSCGQRYSWNENAPSWNDEYAAHVAERVAELFTEETCDGCQQLAAENQQLRDQLDDAEQAILNLIHLVDIMNADPHTPLQPKGAQR